MSESHLFNVISEQWSNLAITQPSIVVLGNTAPRSQMDFIDRYRGIERTPALALRHPWSIAPFVIEIPDNRSCSGWSLRVNGKGVSLIDAVTVVTGCHVVLVGLAMPDARDETFPNS